MGRTKGSKNKAVKTKRVEKSTPAMKPKKEKISVSPVEIDSTQLLFSFAQAINALNSVISTFSTYKEVVNSHIELQQKVNGLLGIVESLHRKLDSKSFETCASQPTKAEVVTPEKEPVVPPVAATYINATNGIGTEDPLDSI